MKKVLGALAIASVTLAPAAYADIAGFEVGAYQWTPDYTGTISSDSGSVLGSSIDIQNDLGFDDDSHNVIWASLEHPVPFLPNIKVVSSDLDNAASSTLTREIVFGGETYSVNEAVSTTFDTSNTEFTFYYEILDNWINLDLGLTLRKYDGEVRLVTPATGSNLNEFEELDFTLPLLYASGRIDLPFTGFFIDGQLNIISYDDDSVSDTSIAFGYESDWGLGAKAGYRMFDLDVEEDSFKGDLEFDGAYISVFYHF
ncbi:TIGR04219 family outer membrane beta-barrel protein [Aliikangiella coralliicola]|uniref:TIGR04219 family outer membrane beta-barrel protein n=1 Tax=Aliikangiella coralliicola TaxID=2592383 RepID=A0A545TWD4_9GAMM|nr:TIGR04219 family outer membrane beta-barrel protein [Aliikangiella coralliicola]TQV81481.1 TIGR04219 family outer membrane beta-barrel protein [Aliikangiella coralliicola]